MEFDTKGMTAFLYASCKFRPQNSEVDVKKRTHPYAA